MVATVRYLPAEDSGETAYWQGKAFLWGQAITVRHEPMLTDIPEGFQIERTKSERDAAWSVVRGKRTSDAVAAKAALLMKHEDPDVRSIAASALAQKR